MQQTLQRHIRGRRSLWGVILGFWLLLHQGFALSPSEVGAALKQLSFGERLFLKEFFLDLIKSDSFGHVVFFDTKPACLGVVSKQCHHKPYSQKMLLKGWECWKSSEHLFPHPNFIFIEEEYLLGEDESIYHIFVINKKTLLSTLHKNIALFQKVLGGDFSPENFLLSLEREKTLWRLLKKDEALLGIILGFGTESSIAFKEQNEHGKNKGRDWAPPWTEHYTRVEALCSKNCKIHPVQFMGDPESQEVRALLERYTEELAEMSKMRSLYSASLNVILSRLCTE